MHLKIGDYDCYAISDGSFKADAAAMFGSAPESLWRSYCTVDANGQMVLGLNCLLVSGKGITLLMEGGIGRIFDHNPSLKKQYAITESNKLEDQIIQCGVSPEDITTVSYSHLHWDHCGTACTQQQDTLIPRFPNAEYIVQKDEWELAADPQYADNYLPHILEPLRTCNQLAVIDGDYPINDDITLVKTGGHTKGHMVLILRSQNAGLLFWGDLIPTRHHIHIPIISAYDTHPEDTYAIKKKLLQLVSAERFHSLFSHDIHPESGSINYSESKFSFSSHA